MRRRNATLSLTVGALLLLALLAVFALELSDTQSRSRRDVTARVHERAVLAAALIDSLFQTVGQQIPQDQRKYGGRVLTNAQMERLKQTNQFLAVLTPDGRVLAHSTGFTPQAQTELASSAALRMVRAGHPYGLGDVLPYGTRGVINLVVQFPTAFGRRLLVTGFTPNSVATFLQGELKRIPGVRGAHNYLLDGRDSVIGSTNPQFPVGHRFNRPAQVQALSRPSGTARGTYFVQAPISNSTWRVLLAAPEGALFASVSGLHKWVPWLIFAGFALAAAVALFFGNRALRSAAEVHEANERLAEVNAELGVTNRTLKRRAAELARSNAELDQFASIASHDLQEPLRKVRTFTQQVIDRESETMSEKGRDYLVRSNVAAERMQRLVEDLLKFSRVSTRGRPFGPVDLGTVTAEVLDDLDAQVQAAGARVEVGPMPTVNGDEPQLRQLVQNLLSNAIKFRQPDVAPRVQIESRRNEETVELVFRDNGIGFDPQYHRRIFRVFERLHGRTEFPGTGIGLALCRKIAERHGGSIEASSEPGAGATFTVILPLHQPEEVLPDPQQRDPQVDEVRVRESVYAGV